MGHLTMSGDMLDDHGGWGGQRWHFEWVEDRDLPMSAMPGTSSGQSPTPSVDHLNLFLPSWSVGYYTAPGQ